jgi:hypothetical protein
MSRGSQYRYLTAAAKQQRQLASMREPGVPCPHCEVTTSPADLPRHLESCSGARDPHHHSKWVEWREAIEMGVPGPSLHRWVRQGRVRSRIRARPEDGPRPAHRPARRVYLLRDIVKLVAHRHRLTSTCGTNPGARGDK